MGNISLSRSGPRALVLLLTGVVVLTASSCPRGGEGSGARLPASSSPPTATTRSETAKTRPIEPAEVELEVVSPKEIPAYRELRLKLALNLDGKRYIGPLRDVYGEPAHLFIVSADLLQFAHLIPEVEWNGLFSSTVRFPAPGQFSLFLLAHPEPLAEPVLLRQDFEIPGMNPQGPPPREKLTDQIGQEITLNLRPQGELRAGEEVELILAASRTPVGDPLYLAEHPPAPYHLGEAYGGRFFVTMIRVGERRPRFALLGEESVVSAGDNTFRARLPLTFPGPGRWKLWVEFSFGGRELTSTFVVEVGEGKK